MRTEWVIAAALIAASAVVDAQTYDLDITMTGIVTGPVTFSGTFNFNANGTGFCSATFCAPGTTPDFADVLIKDPLSQDPPGALSHSRTSPVEPTTFHSLTLMWVRRGSRASFTSSHSPSAPHSVVAQRASASATSLSRRTEMQPAPIPAVARRESLRRE